MLSLRAERTGLELAGPRLMLFQVMLFRPQCSTETPDLVRAKVADSEGGGGPTRCPQSSTEVDSRAPDRGSPVPRLILGPRVRLILELRTEAHHHAWVAKKANEHLEDSSVST